MNGENMAMIKDVFDEAAKPWATVVSAYEVIEQGQHAIRVRFLTRGGLDHIIIVADGRSDPEKPLAPERRAALLSELVEAAKDWTAAREPVT